MSGGSINRKLTIATAIGITRAVQPSLLPENGGHLLLNKSWADSILKIIGYVKRKGTKAATKLPENYDELAQEYVKRIVETVKKSTIPWELVVTMDETALPIIPVSDWTLVYTGENFSFCPAGVRNILVMLLFIRLVLLV